jgi:hypothetical protein
MYTLTRPLPGLPAVLRLLWPLIFVQLVVLKAWVRRHYGRGVPYSCTVSRAGRVRLLRLPADLCASATAPAAFGPEAAALASDLCATAGLVRRCVLRWLEGGCAWPSALPASTVQAVSARAARVRYSGGPGLAPDTS